MRSFHLKSRKWIACAAFACASLVIARCALRVSAAASEIVLYAADVTNMQGNWAKWSGGDAAGGQYMASNDYGWSTLNNGLSSPGDYFEASFNAASSTPYHVWLRMRAGSNSKWNDSVWVQFSDSTDQNGSPIYRIGTSSALMVNLEPCNGCGVGNWGWQDGAYWLSQLTSVRFASNGGHTIRIQIREDGVQIDQMVLSPSAYLYSAPGRNSGDTTILQEALGDAATAVSSAATSLSPSSGGPSPFRGSPAPIPGRIEAEDFDNGGQGVAYGDSSGGNNGGAYRQGDVDIEASSDGGYDVGWITPGEWLNYSVSVTTSGSYQVQLRVASPAGASMHVGFNGSAGVWQTVSIPSTGGWQNWTTVTLPVTLGSGTQLMTLLFDTGGMNLSYTDVSSAAASSTQSQPSGLSPYGGSPVTLPGTIEAENFDNGGEGVSYHDSDPANRGGAYRNTGVDLESSSEGGYDVAYTSAGEWLNYTVNVTSSGSYTVALRVASPSGGAMHVGFNGSSGVWSSVAIPATGGWQSWTTVNVPVTLGAGVQQMTVLFDTGGVNLSKLTVASGSVPSAPSAPPPSATGTTLRMITWNIQSGTDSNHSYSLPQQVQLLASLNPDVVVLQEVSMWNENQPDKFLTLMQQATGRTWYKVWAPAVTCETSGCIGPEILSRIPINDASTTYLGPSSAGRALINVGGVPINIVTNHLEAYDTSVRTSELYALMAWERQFGGPRLDAGDFNSWWGEWWIGQMTSEYHDTWRDYTGSNEDGYTYGNVRIDYIFRAFEGDWRLTPTNAFVVSTSLSDHRPFVADFRVQ